MALREIKIEDREIYKGYKAKQKIGTIKSLDKFFACNKFDIIIEIGTVPGTFAHYLFDKANEMNIKFYTFDIRPIGKVFAKMKIFEDVFYLEDCLKTTIIPNLLKSNNKVCILNDGDKIKSFYKFSSLLKPGDYLLTHDYYKDEDFTELGSVTLGELLPAIIENNLDICYQDIFDDVLWICCTKEIDNETTV